MSQSQAQGHAKVGVSQEKTHLSSTFLQPLQPWLCISTKEAQLFKQSLSSMWTAILHLHRGKVSRPDGNPGKPQVSIVSFQIRAALFRQLTAWTVSKRKGVKLHLAWPRLCWEKYFEEPKTHLLLKVLSFNSRIIVTISGPCTFHCYF